MEASNSPWVFSTYIDKLLMWVNYETHISLPNQPMKDIPFYTI